MNLDELREIMIMSYGGHVLLPMQLDELAAKIIPFPRIPARDSNIAIDRQRRAKDVIIATEELVIITQLLLGS